MKRRLRVAISAVILSVTFTTLFGANNTLLAVNTLDITQTINAGALATDVRDAGLVSVTSPSFGLSALTFSFNCAASTGVLGSDSQRIYVDNPGAADGGWTLTVAATDGATTNWQNTGATASFDFNDPTSSGCTDGADTDLFGGQLGLNPSAGTLTADCASCTTANITKGSATAFSQGSTDSITLLTAAAGSDDSGRWYLTDVTANQTIPAQQTVSNYSINLTITATAS